MSAPVRRHDMVSYAFLHLPLLRPIHVASPRVARNSRSACRQGVVVRRAVRIVPTCNSDRPQNSDSTQPSQKLEGPSRTFIGRIAVEFLSLVVGAVLLLLVVAWRACQVFSLNVWRAVVWLSNVRQLGKWAVQRVARADNIALPIVSLRKIVSRVYGFTLSGVTKREQENESNSVVEADPVKEEKDLEIKVPESDHTQHAQECNATNVDIATGRRLILLRHAKTTWDRKSEVPDHDRVLSAKGKEEARLVGYELARTSWLPDVVLCSDAVRTVQTFSLLNIPDQSPVSTTCTEALYYAVTGDEMASAVDDTLGERGFTDDTTLMVVCHNPGCEELVEQLTGHRLDMGTGCAALLEYNEHVEEKADEASNSFRLSPQKMNWSLARVLRPALLSSSPT